MSSFEVLLCCECLVTEHKHISALSIMELQLHPAALISVFEAQAMHELIQLRVITGGYLNEQAGRVSGAHFHSRIPNCKVQLESAIAIGRLQFDGCL